MKGGDEVRLSNTSKRKQEMARRKEQRKMDLERKRKERGKHSINIFMVWQRTVLFLYDISIDQKWETFYSLSLQKRHCHLKELQLRTFYYLSADPQ